LQHIGSGQLVVLLLFLNKLPLLYASKQVFWWQSIRWGTFAFAVFALFNLGKSSYLIPAFLSTLFALWSLIDGRKSLVRSFNLLGVRDPAQALVLVVIGVMYWAAASAGLMVVMIKLDGVIPEIIRMFIVVFGTLSFTGGGSMSVFCAEPDPCPWR